MVGVGVRNAKTENMPENNAPGKSSLVMGYRVRAFHLQVALHRTARRSDDLHHLFKSRKG